MCFEFDYVVSTDGGAAANGTADSFGFGSYHLESRTGQKQMVRLEFGRGVTNNEAEYRTLIAGLRDLAGRIERAGKSASDYSLLVHTDSQLMVGQVAQDWQVKAVNVRPPHTADYARHRIRPSGTIPCLSPEIDRLTYYTLKAIIRPGEADHANKHLVYSILG